MLNNTDPEEYGAIAASSSAQRGTVWKCLVGEGTSERGEGYGLSCFAERGGVVWLFWKNREDLLTFSSFQIYVLSQPSRVRFIVCHKNTVLSYWGEGSAVLSQPEGGSIKNIANIGEGHALKGNEIEDSVLLPTPIISIQSQTHCGLKMQWNTLDLKTSLKVE